ncbi:MAG TPA: 3-isopropylmalate dehydrogenase [Hypericibacter adhaerens]|uniref:3-isopropylmalate dehydrogenase n=1 Tax=Hypericibacter adhaerens TaxID=2602016 RepID=UPI002D0EA843|nr:3-isopropylmalate dehydrogenase [Hypericibacter adhaerens]HWA45837.1 3-isopropylmalate dehydrogenase [Hypericibacter adhaerens]
MTRQILVLGGDGIGPEVTAAAERVLSILAGRHKLALAFEHALVGGACYDATGLFITDATMAKAKAADAILFGAEGGPKWDSLELTGPPETRSGLTRLRRELELYANLRPIRPFEALLAHSTLKPEIVRGVDFMIVRELCGGIYFGEPRGIERKGDGLLHGFDTQDYSEPEIERIAHASFALARSRRRKLCSVDKANVMESGILWRRTLTRIGERDYPEVELSHLYVDNAAMQIVRNPRQFDVIVTDNLFGDILSDGAAMITGSLGMLPSASLGTPRPDGRRPGLYEPVHGSAPDIAGQGLANPLGAIMSAALLLTHGLGRPDLAQIVERAVARTLEAGIATPDLGGKAGTGEVLAAVIEAL